MSDALRAFFAVDLPRDARDRVAGAAEALRDHIPGARWVGAEQLHITLKFIAELDPDQVPRLLQRAQAKLAASAPFACRLGGLGAFPGAREARVIWLGVQDGTRPLAQLARRVDAAAGAVGVQRERRPFRAHVTLGRLRQAARVDLLQAPAPPDVAFSVEEVILYESRLSPDGARHIPLAQLPLLRAEDAEEREFAPES